MNFWRVVLLNICCFLCVASCSSGKNDAFVQTAPLTFVRAQGKAIVTDRDEPVFLRGINFGAWLFWDGGALSLPCVTEHEFRQALEARLPLRQDLVTGFFTGIREHYIREGDFSVLSSRGIHYVRLCFHYRYANDENIVWIDRAVQWAKRNHVYIMLNMHVTPGGQNISYYADTDGEARLWNDVSCQDELVRVWEFLARRYKDEPAVLGYELINEPQAPTGQDLAILYKRVINAIRALDTRHVIFLDGNNYARDFTGLMPAELGGNIAYVFHAYDAAASLPAMVSQYRAFQDLHNVPVLCNEYGGLERVAMTTYFESESISHAPWGYKLAFDTEITAQFYYMPQDNVWKVRFLVPFYTYFLTHNQTMKMDVATAIHSAVIPDDCKNALIDKLDANGFLSPPDFLAAVKSYPAYATALASLYQQIDDIQLPYWADAAVYVLQNLDTEGLNAVTSDLETEYWARGNAHWIE